MADRISDAHAAYADTLAHHSALIIGAVHDLGPDAVQDAIDRALIVEAPAGIDPAVALVTILAAQIDPTTRTSQRLGWVIDREQARARLIAQHNQDADDDADIVCARLLGHFDDGTPAEKPDDARALAVIAGHGGLSTLPHTHRLVVVQVLRLHGLSCMDTSARLGCGRNTVSRYRALWRDTHPAPVEVAAS
jgi:hypothetical protein